MTHDFEVNVDNVRGPIDEPIAVIGMACRFPGADDLEGFWELLRDGVDAITEFPIERAALDDYFDSNPGAPGRMNTRHGGFLRAIDAFDPLFFGISPREAVPMDPQQRLMLELAWEACEDAGVVPGELSGSRTGVYTGIVWNDYARELHKLGAEAIVQHSLVGESSALLANRVSYFMGLQGPSLALDSACSSSLVAVHLGCQSLRLGECDFVLAGATNTLICPESTVTVSKFGATSPDGRCKAFDAGANGYVRGEGAAMVLLAPLRKALVAGHPIRCILLSTVVNNDGTTNGITVPSGAAQAQMLVEAYRRAGIDAQRVDYVEAHGTGTSVGDPIEANAIGEALGKGREPGRPLRIGSVKTNIGHTEAVAGLAGLIKVALAMQHRVLPANLHFREPNPSIAFDDLRLSVQTTLAPWTDRGDGLVAGVNSFGAGGTNGHVVVASAPRGAATLITVSAPSVDALDLRLQHLAELAADPRIELDALGRSLADAVHHPHRVAIVACSHEELRDALAAAREGRAHPRLFTGHSEGSVALVFTAGDVPWPGMGRTLLGAQPAFRAALLAQGGPALVDAIAGRSAAAAPDALVAGVEVALAALVRGWGLEPDAVVERGADPELAQSLAERGYHVVNAMEALRRGRNEMVAMSALVAQLYVLGKEPAWHAVHPPDARRIDVSRVADERRSGEESSRRWRLLPLSARTPEALKDTVERTRRFVAERPGMDLDDLAATASLRRTHHAERLAVAFQDGEGLLAALDARLQSESPPGVVSARVLPPARSKVVFVFSGQGGQWHGMGREGLLRHAASREALERCDAVIRAETGWSLIEELEADEASSRLARIDVLQPVLFALQVAGAAWMRSWGVVPDAVVGHSMGEVAAAHVAGALSLEDAARVICRRSRLLRTISGKGAMAVVELEIAEAQAVIGGRADKLSVAVSNGPRSTVLAGDPNALDEVLAQLEARGVFCRRVQVDVASHSPQVDPLLPELVRVLEGLQPQVPAIAMRSTVVGRTFPAGQPVAEGGLDASYWVRNLREPVLFADAIRDLSRDGHGIFLEVGPHPVLTPAVEQGLAEWGQGGRALGLMRRGQPEEPTLLAALGELHAVGAPVDFRRLHPTGGRHVRLPTYAFQRERHWFDVRSLGANRSAEGRALVAATHEGLSFWEYDLNAERLAWIGAHRIAGVHVLPMVGYTLLLRRAAQAVELGEGSVSALAFEQPCSVADGEARTLQFSFQRESDDTVRFAVASRVAGSSWTKHASGIWTVRADVAAPATIDLAGLRARCTEHVSGEQHEESLRSTGLEVGAALRVVQEVFVGDGETVARLRGGGGKSGALNLLDGCVQITGPLLERADLAEGRSPAMYVTARVGRLDLRALDASEAWGTARLRPSDNGYVADLSLFDEEGRVLAQVDDLEVRRLATSVAKGPSPFYELAWRPEPLSARSGRRNGPWVILSDSLVGPKVAAALAQAGERVVCVVSGRNTLEKLDGIEVREVAPSSADALARALESICPDGTCSGVVHLWSLNAPASAEDASDQALECGVFSALDLVQAAVAAAFRDGPRLWFVTRGAVAVGDDVPSVAVAQAAVWGLARVVVHEQPSLRCSRFDLDPRSDDSDVPALVTELLAGSAEDQVALRGGLRHAARLVGSSLPDGEGPVRIREDGTYVVTGGLGGLGLLVARWLVDSGARHLVLLGRRGITEEAAPIVGELEAKGAEVLVAGVDVSDRDQLAKTLDGARAGMPPLRGIVHAAGVVDDAMLTGLDRARMANVLAPKLHGGLHLHEVTLEDPLDFFVMYSSASSLLGAPGVGSYVAANACLDALAAHRRAMGRPATSVAWGTWASVGLLGRLAGRETARYARAGFRPLAAEAGLGLLGRIIEHAASAPALLGAMQLDMRSWGETYPAVSGLPTWSSLQTVQGPAEGDGFADSVRRAPPDARAAMVEQHLRQVLGDVLQLSRERMDPTTPFAAFGLDSLMSLEARNRLERSVGTKLSATLLWANPTLSALSQFVLTLLAPEPVAEVRVEAAPPSFAAAEETDILDALAALQELPAGALDQLVD